MKPFEGLKKEDAKLATMLENSGMAHNQAHILTFVKASGEATSKDIQGATKLRQPEVSIAMKALRAKKWVEKKDLRKEKGKGRPTHVYFVQSDLGEIIDHFIDECRAKMAEIQADIEELEALKKSL